MEEGQGVGGLGAEDGGGAVGIRLIGPSVFISGRFWAGRNGVGVLGEARDGEGAIIFSHKSAQERVGESIGGHGDGGGGVENHAALMEDGQDFPFRIFFEGVMSSKKKITDNTVGEGAEGF